jgi:hypothetical protein
MEITYVNQKEFTMGA